MGWLLSAILYQSRNELLMFYCPGCNTKHGVYIAENPDNKPIWSWNGDALKPTFSPSIVIRMKDQVCHSFVRDGKIEFLEDCTHSFKSKTVDLPTWPQPVAD